MKIKLTFAALICCMLTIQTYADPVTKSQAKSIASSFLQTLDGSDVAATSVKTKTINRVAAADTLAPYYVFSRGAGKGFVIVSGDDCTSSIIGYTESGDFDADNMPEAFKNMLEGWSELVTKAQAAGAKARVNASKTNGMRKAASTKKDVAPLCKTLWGQGSPWNLLCPTITSSGNRALTGCVATAAAQIIYYFHKDNPDSLLYATPTYSYGDAPVTTSLPKGTKIDYANMLLEGSGTAVQNNAVATLMVAIGTSSYLTYGSSTSGQISNAGTAMSGQFRLSGTCIYKSGYSQSSWEDMVYSSLAAGKPILYCGVHPTNGGHAVVLDGYQSSTNKFHFNFGWNNASYNGYFTVDDSTGMNGFYGQQGMVYNITPKIQNVSGKILDIKNFYQKCNSTLSVRVKNNSTIDYSGVYLYCTTASSLPSNESAKDITTAITSGDSTTFYFTYKPTLQKTYHIFLCNANKTILDSCSVVAQSTTAALHLNKMSIAAGSTTQNIDGITFKTVNNTTADVTVNLTNGEGGSYCQPTLQCDLYQYDTTTKTWNTEAVSNRYLSSIVFNEGETKDTVFRFSGLTPGLYYMAIMNHTATAGVKSNIAFDTADSVVFFTVKEADLAMTATGRNATVSGAWDLLTFTRLAKDTSVCNYDMTAVTELNAQPVAANPNALFYASNKVAGAYNIIADNICDSLVINENYDFVPTKAFTATKARFNLDASTGLWGDVIIPFAAKTPYGTVVRTIDGIKTTALSLSNVSTIPAMTPCLYIIDHISRNHIDAEGVTIGTDTLASIADNTIKGYTVKITLPETDESFGYTSNGYPYYLIANVGGTVKAFNTSIAKSAINIRALNNLTTDFQYTHLADTISKAKDVLANYKNNDLKAYTEFTDSIQMAEDAFTNQTLSTTAAIKLQYNNLSTAIEQYLNSVITGITASQYSDGSNAATEYYSVTGIRLREPQRGINIIREGKTVRKVIIK